MPVNQPLRQYSPPGTVAAFAGTNAPGGWLKCNGQAVSRATYGALFAYIGTTYGAGDGSTTFNLPDMRGEFPRGADDGRGVDAGRAVGSTQGHQSNNLAEVRMEYIGSPPGSATTDDGGAWSAAVNSGEEGVSPNYALAFRLHGRETRPRNVALLYCIKT